MTIGYNIKQKNIRGNRKKDINPIQDQQMSIQTRQFNFLNKTNEETTPYNLSPTTIKVIEYGVMTIMGVGLIVLFSGGSF